MAQEDEIIKQLREEIKTWKEANERLIKERNDLLHELEQVRR